MILLTLTDRLYRLLLWLYPDSYRREYGGEMALVFGDCLRAAYQRGGELSVISVWLAAVFDLLSTALQERRHRRTIMSSNGFFARISGYLMIAAGLLFVLASYSQLQPGTWLIRSGLYATAGNLLVPAFLLTAVALAAAYFRLKPVLERLSSLLLIVAVAGIFMVIVFGTAANLPDAVSGLWNIAMVSLIGSMIALALFGGVVWRLGHRWGVFPLILGGLMLAFFVYSSERGDPSYIHGPHWVDFAITVIWGVCLIGFGRTLFFAPAAQPVPAAAR